MSEHLIDIDHLIQATGSDCPESLTPAVEAEETTVWPSGFAMRTDGLYWMPDSSKAEVWLSDPFAVEAEGREPGGTGWSLLLSWRDRDNQPHRMVVRRADLTADGSDVRQRLADRGLALAAQRGARERFLEALSGVASTQRVVLAAATGWRDGAFVLPHRTIGGPPGEAVLHQGRGEGTYFGQRGSLAEWQEHVAQPAGDHHRLVFALALAFSGPLLEPLGLEGGGFHFFGPSSCGKTTLLRLAGSVWGGGGETGFGLTWRATANALEGVAAAHNGTLLALDEVGQVSPHDLDAAVYALANGQAKTRMRADTELRARLRWRVPILSTGEITVSDRIREAGSGRRVRAGQEVRLLDVPAEAGAGHGVFDLAPAEGAHHLASALQQASAAYYGTAGPAFIEGLLGRWDDMLAAGREFLSHVPDQLAPEGSDGQVRRAAQRFALVAAAGEFAIELGVLPWPKEAVLAAVRRTFEAWLARRGGGVRREEQVALETVAHFLQRYGQSRFAAFPTGSMRHGDLDGLRPIADLAGWRRGDEFLIQTAAWGEITRGLNRRFVAEVLAARGHLTPGADGKNAQSITVLGHKQRLYVVPAKILEEADGGA